MGLGPHERGERGGRGRARTRGGGGNYSGPDTRGSVGAGAPTVPPFVAVIADAGRLGWESVRTREWSQGKSPVIFAFEGWTACGTAGGGGMGGGGKNMGGEGAEAGGSEPPRPRRGEGPPLSPQLYIQSNWPCLGERGEDAVGASTGRPERGTEMPRLPPIPAASGGGSKGGQRPAIDGCGGNHAASVCGCGGEPSVNRSVAGCGCGCGIVSGCGSVAGCGTGSGCGSGCGCIVGIGPAAAGCAVR